MTSTTVTFQVQYIQGRQGCLSVEDGGRMNSVSQVKGTIPVLRVLICTPRCDPGWVLMTEINVENC